MYGDREGKLHVWRCLVFNYHALTRDSHQPSGYGQTPLSSVTLG